MIARGEADGDAVRRRRPRGAVREPRRRRQLGAQRGPVGAAVAAALAAGRRRAVPALDLHLAGRSRQAGGRGLGRRDVADRGRRAAPGVAATRGSTRATCPRRRSRTRTPGRCVHHVERAPERPERMFMQFHGGVYRSDDAGESWSDIGGGGLPSDFGFPLMVDPGRSRQRVRDPARRRHGPGHPRRPRARLRDARRRRRAGRRAATGCRPSTPT